MQLKPHDVYLAVEPDLRQAKEKVTKKIIWEKIQIGQPFYFYGCEGIAIKTGDNTVIIVEAIHKDIDHRIFGYQPGDSFTLRPGQIKDCKLYELSKSLADEIV